MKTEKQIKEMIQKTLDDDRMKGYGTTSYKPANVRINAPLALIQTTNEGFIAALRWVLEEIE